VCDPFTGSGTTGEVSLQLGRRFVGIEPVYGPMARSRVGAACPDHVRAHGGRFRAPVGPLFPEIEE
jgi:hypothetical protein